MRTKDLVLRCYAEKQGNVWVAACIDLCLSAQDDTAELAINRLHSQIGSYLAIAFSDPDKQYGADLLERMAPIDQQLKFHFIRSKVKIYRLIQKALSFQLSTNEKAFKERFPLKPASC